MTTFGINAGKECTTAPIAPGEACELRFFFRPFVVGSFKGVIVIETDDPTSPYRIDFVGEGV